MTFAEQYAREMAVRIISGLGARSREAHADYLLRHRWVLGHGDSACGILREAAAIVTAAGLVPSRWVHINADDPAATSLFRCAACGTVSKYPMACRRGCTDVTAACGFNPDVP